MKKWIVVLIVAGLIGAVWYYVRTYVRYTPVWYQPKFGKVTRGDIRVPITASGLVEPNQRIEVKSKASGEVIAVPVVEGTFVRQGDVLLVLKKDDEQRKFDGAQAELDRARAMLAQAEVSVAEAKANISSAEADIERLLAQCRISEFNVAKVQANPAVYSEDEKVTIPAQHQINLAQLKAAEARLAAAHSALHRAEESIKIQQAAVRVAETQLGDARERLDETTIVAKQDALVTDVRVKISEVIQSGTLSLTGGTPVMYLADVSKKKVVARVDESDYGRVLKISPKDALPEMPGLHEAVASGVFEMQPRSGRVTLTVDAFPEDTFEGVIERVEPQGRLSPGSAIIQYDVHVAITDPRSHLLPLGAQAQVEFTVESATDVLRIPSEAVKTEQGRRGVYIEVEPEPGSNEQWGKRFVPCRFGITDGEYTQVLEVQADVELKEGQRVYTQLPVDRERLQR